MVQRTFSRAISRLSPCHSKPRMALRAIFAYFSHSSGCVPAFSVTMRSLRSSMPMRSGIGITSPVVVSYRLARNGASPHVISRRTSVTKSSQVFLSFLGNVTGLFVARHDLLPSIVNGDFFRSNHAASMRLFMALQIHDGVNTSALPTTRLRCSSLLLSTRGRTILFPGRETTSALISSWIPILTSNTDSRCAYPSVIHMMFLPVVRSASKTCKTSLGISDSRISRVKSGSITPRSSCEQSVVLAFILMGCIIPNLLPSCFSHRLSFV